ncbi:alpha/beta hydrolase fold domain-containing protein [Hyphococcus flavus]|uniref:Alpha/beta hydrolase fold domain-containing protein n=1 Tax=Hyphococcus flavus TaxID=1866326 RepID=A0AAE9Z9T7_9PROT|nr:alpha/beta hydrolase fold domain-containing protein [Hyphococcus flavus]WDI30053.1 alpha/beta hydrolase fold domain-containing protein [Hyphococcus flavus]
MALAARRLGKAISDTARAHIAGLRTYPTLDTWMNPLTRGLARHFANQEWLKALDEIDFPYRMSDDEIAGVSCVRYETQTARRDDLVLLYVHGGGLVSGSPRVNASMILPTCHLSGVDAVGVDYTLLPEARFPTQIDQVDSVYRSLLNDGSQRRVVIFGDSIGGAIATAAMLRWRDEGVKIPAAAILVSPALDGAGASDTHYTLDGHDPLIRSNGGRNCRKLFSYYAPGEKLNNPMVSPIYGNFEGFPPMLAHVGLREVLLGDAARFTQAARRAGADATLRVYDGMFHLFHMHWSLAETREAHADIAEFIKSL